jgi:hypothetical protein
MKPVLLPLVCDPISQLGIFAVACRNIASTISLSLYIAYIRSAKMNDNQEPLMLMFRTVQ